MLPQLATAFGVTVDELLIQQPPAIRKLQPGPVSETQRVFEQVRQLPRRQRKKVLEMVTALVERYQRKAS